MWSRSINTLSLTMLRLSLSKTLKVPLNPHPELMCTHQCVLVYRCVTKCLLVCTVVVTSNWSVCSCLCFSSSPLVCLSLASSSLDLSSSDSCMRQWQTSQHQHNEQADGEEATGGRACTRLLTHTHTVCETQNVEAGTEQTEAALYYHHKVEMKTAAVFLINLHLWAVAVKSDCLHHRF